MKAKKKALNPVASAWVKALRSGDYKQGRRHLKKDGNYCCLGVLCELAVKAKVIQKFDGRLGVLSRTVMEWAGLADLAGEFRTESYPNYLTSQNDSGMTFVEIADLIESQPEGLFK